jgi:hypothetical protein
MENVNVLFFLALMEGKIPSFLVRIWKESRIKLHLKKLITA